MNPRLQKLIKFLIFALLIAGNILVWKDVIEGFIADTSSSRVPEHLLE
jgi:hypothetical protein